MNFISPGQLLWLLPLGGVIVALYLLRMRRQDYKVPASFLWPQRTEEVRANALLQKLKFNWLMVLQLLALLFLVFCLARPKTEHKGLTSGITVFVIDTGASMGATDVLPTRLEEAKKEVREAIEAAPLKSQIAIILAASSPRVVVPLTADRTRLLKGLKDLQQTDEPGKVEEALRLGTALCSGRNDAGVVLLSDGDFEPLNSFSSGKASFVAKTIGKSGSNVGFESFGISDAKGGRLLYAGVRNFGTEPRDIKLNVLSAGKVLESRELHLGPNGLVGSTFQLASQNDIFEGRLVGSDALDADNYAVCSASSHSHLRVLIVEPEADPFLEKALALDPRVELDKTDTLPTSEVAGNGRESKYDLVVLDGAPAAKLKTRSVLTFAATEKGGASKTKFLDEEKVPLMDGVDLSTTFVGNLKRLDPGSGTVVAEASAGGENVPLIIASEGAQRRVDVAFSLRESDFALQVSFPIFVSNALDFLAGQASDDLVVQTGQPFTLPSETDSTLTDSRGQSRTLKPTSGTIHIEGLPLAGHYNLTANHKEVQIYAQLRDRTSSRIEPKKVISTDTRGSVPPSYAISVAELWKWAACIALIALCGEWWLFARRS